MQANNILFLLLLYNFLTFFYDLCKKPVKHRFTANSQNQIACPKKKRLESSTLKTKIDFVFFGQIIDVSLIKLLDYPCWCMEFNKCERYVP